MNAPPVARSARARGRGPTFGLLLALALGIACGNEPAATPGPPDATYRVRGEIRQLPGPNGREILIRHEAIPELRDAKGAVVGMDSMTMPFTLGADVDRTGLAEGQRIEFTLEVRWDGGDPIVVRELTALPAGTRLGFDPPETATSLGTGRANP